MTGPLALVGSGEYTAAMRATDRALLERVAGGRAARIALVPTASGLEPGMPAVWNARGVAHFQALGAHVDALSVITREDCASPAVVAAIAAADLVYFSGGNPNYLTECWRDTPAWRALIERWRAGAAIAGCSAGAMMLGACTVRVRDMMAGQKSSWTPALSAAPRIAVMPHFDRTAAFVSAAAFGALLRAAPAGVTVVGIDEDTALVSDNDGSEWTVSGRQSVSVFLSHDAPMILSAGQSVRI
jgi:cyanophycinase